MSLWQHLEESIDRRESGARKKSLGREVLAQIQKLAVTQGCAEEEVVISLLDQALKANRRNSRTYRCWEKLSQREKEVAALVCSGLTGRQIAARLVLSPETIKTHVRHILRKFNLNSRQDLRNLLAGWDFSRWLPSDRTLQFPCPSILDAGIRQEVFDTLEKEYEV